MARHILGQGHQEIVALSVSEKSAVDRKIGAKDCDKILRSKRRAKYIESMTQLDVGCHLQSPQKIKELIDALHAEFPELSLEQMPIGIVAKCYLGKPFEVHTLDVEKEIVQHYKQYESLPLLLEKARSLAMHPSYIFIEVYADSLRAITADGSVSVIKE